MTAFKNPFVSTYHVEISNSFKSIDISLFLFDKVATGKEKFCLEKFCLHSLITKHKYLAILICECKNV